MTSHATANGAWHGGNVKPASAANKSETEWGKATTRHAHRLLLPTLTQEWAATLLGTQPTIYLFIKSKWKVLTEKNKYCSMQNKIKWKTCLFPCLLMEQFTRKSIVPDPALKCCSRHSILIYQVVLASTSRLQIIMLKLQSGEL